MYKVGLLQIGWTFKRVTARSMNIAGCEMHGASERGIIKSWQCTCTDGLTERQAVCHVFNLCLAEMRYRSMNIKHW